ncbi:MAG: nitroreductase family deazaflavin-dependent oxidoreductase [candidate division NC10 bacterium]|nr:nitroreductase family deazaflavin-dependent oxidoreductase [candidate division NC10 bacterium]
MYLYLTAIGWKSGLPREIEIWFTAQNGRYYVIAEHHEQAHWVKNIRQNPEVSLRVGGKEYRGLARILDPRRESDLCREVSEQSEAKYGWGEGLIVELIPASSHQGMP